MKGTVKTEYVTRKKMTIDPNFDFRSDVKPGQDPDKYSKTLQAYHKKLWSKPLPNGVLFDLIDDGQGTLLFHQSELGVFSLSSDSISHSYIYHTRTQHIIGQLDEQRKEEILRSLSAGFIRRGVENCVGTGRSFVGGDVKKQMFLKF